MGKTFCFYGNWNAYKQAYCWEMNRKIKMDTKVSILVILSFVSYTLSIEEQFSYMTPNNCSEFQYFDWNNIKCVSCPEGFYKSDDGSFCYCPSNYKLLKSSDVSKQKCIPCKPMEIVSSDRSACVPRPCFNSTKGKINCIVCNANQIEIKSHVNGTLLPNVSCVTCSTGFTPSDDKSECIACSMDKPCGGCNLQTSVVFQDICVPNSFIKNITSIFDPKLQQPPSYFVEDNWILANYLCNSQNNEACQMLANLCVLSLYNDAEKSPCDKWRKQRGQLFSYLMYGEDEAPTVLYRKKIPITYSLNKNSMHHKLDIVGMVTTTEGKNLGEISHARWILPCPSIWKDSDTNLFKYAVNYRHKCTIGAQQLVEQSETLFYEPYLKYSDNDTSVNISPTLYAIPVLIKGDMISLNTESDLNTWQLVRRFYLFDKLSGLMTLSNGSKKLKYFRYAKNINIKINVRRKGKGERNKIYPPLITLEYAELSENDIQNNDDVKLSFSITYELDGGNMLHSMEIAIGSLSAFATLYSILQSWSNARRSGKFGLDIYTVVQFFIFAAGNLANVFFTVAFGASFYSFLLYKTQKTLFVLPPLEKDESAIKTYIIVAFSLKIIELLAMNWTQIRIDISFIDWEKPIHIINDIPHKLNTKTDIPVSFWRPYFVANELNELQTLRKINLPIHLVSCIAVIEIFGVSGWSYIGKNVNGKSMDDALSSSVYQFAVAGIIYLLLYFIHLILAIFIYERFMKNCIQDFMDVCSIANISILFLDSQLHGYYLHGRCIHASCDTDARGLQAGLPFRAFIVRCTSEFRLYFNRLNIHMISKDVKWEWQHHLSIGKDNPNIDSSTITSLQVPNSRSGSKGMRRGDDALHSNLPASLQHREHASRLQNKFLTAFFDHALEDVDYEVREKRFVERLMDVELIDESSNRTLLLYNSTGDPQSFQRLLWYGQEWTLATFDIYLFSFVVITSGDYILAAFITAITWKCLSIGRQYFGKKNLAKKTLVDERFLI